MKIINILQKILKEQTVEPAAQDGSVKVEPAAQDATATKYTEPGEPKKGVNIDTPKQTEDTYSQQIQDALSNLNSLGYSKEEASAIVANMRFESFLNPESLNKNDKGAPAFGLIQWRGTDVRYENGKLVAKPSTTPSRLKKLLQQDGYNTMSTQIKFLHDELTNDPYESRQFNKVKNGKTAYEMGKLFDQYVERSDGAIREKRGKYAQNIFNDINNGHYQYT
jgi:hypothetical protein